MGEKGRNSRRIRSPASKQRSVVLAVSHPWASSYLPISLRSFSPILAAISTPRGRPTLVLALSPRLLPLHPLTHDSPRPRSATPPLSRSASLASRRNSALLSAYFGPSSPLVKMGGGRESSAKQGWDGGTARSKKGFEIQGKAFFSNTKFF